MINFADGFELASEIPAIGDIPLAVAAPSLASSTGLKNVRTAN